MFDDKENDSRIVRRRLWLILFFLAAFMLFFVSQLYHHQIVNGDEYLERSQRNITHHETVPAARGKLLDSLGRVLVSNRVSYQATLDTALLGKGAQRNATLLELLALCREHNIEWNESLRVSAHATLTFTNNSP